MRETIERFGAEARAAPASFLLWATVWIAALAIGVSFGIDWYRDYRDNTWRPFTGFEMNVSTDGMVLYYDVSGVKNTSAGLEAQIPVFTIGGVPEAVVCYRADGTICEPSRLFGFQGEFQSNILRSIIPVEALGDANATFRLCFTYSEPDGDRTWCTADVLLEDAEEWSGAPLEPLPLSSVPRSIAPL